MEFSKVSKQHIPKKVMEKKSKDFIQNIIYEISFVKSGIIERNENNEDALHNLELAQLKIVDKIESIPALPFEEWIDSIVSFLTTDHWAILSILLLWLSFLFFGINQLV